MSALRAAGAAVAEAGSVRWLGRPRSLSPSPRLPRALAMGPGPASRPSRPPLIVALCAALLVLLPPSLGAGERRRLACSTCRGIVDRFNQVGGGGATVQRPRCWGCGRAPRREAGRGVPPGSLRRGGSGAGRSEGQPPVCGAVSRSGRGGGPGPPGSRRCGPAGGRFSSPQRPKALGRRPVSGPGGAP